MTMLIVSLLGFTYLVLLLICLKYFLHKKKYLIKDVAFILLIGFYLCFLLFICLLTNITEDLTSILGLYLFALGFFSLPQFALITLGGFFNKDFFLILKTSLIFYVSPLFWFIIFMGLFMFESTPQGGRFFKLHAAIKNTCYLDKTKVQCPHNLTELSYIEPLEFKNISARNQLVYEYYPESNEYTLIVRYSKYNAAVFDPRLIPIYGIDYHEYVVNTLGQDSIVGAPDVPGPWNKLPDWKGWW